MATGSVTVAGLELRRTVRALAGDRTKLLMMAAVVLLMLGPIAALGVYFLPTLGEEVAAGTIPAETAATVTDVVTGGTAVVWLFMTFMAIMRAITTVADIDEPAFLLLSTTVRNTVVGTVAAEAALWLLCLVPAAILLAAAFATGAGTALPVLVVPLLVTILVVTAVSVGFVVGICIRHLITVYEPIAQHRTLLFAAFWIAYFGAIATGGFDTVMGTLFTQLQESPLGWPGHVLLLGVPGFEPSTAGIGGAIVGGVLVVGVALAAAVPAARIHWYSDPARPDEDDLEEEESTDRLSGLLSGVVSRPVRTVTVTAIRRTKRAPIRLVYAGYPLLGSLGFIQQIVESGTVQPYMAVVFCLYVIWTAGVLFTLNPLGDLGPGLPAVLTSTLSGRAAIRGRVIAGALVGVPLAAVVSLGFGLASPLSMEQTAALVAGTVVGAVATPALATGVGSVFPRFGSVKVTNNREAVMPSKTAFLVYTLAIALPAVAAVVLYLEAPELIADFVAWASALAPGPEMSIAARTITVGAWIVLVTGLVAPVVSYRYAIERFDWYRLD